MKTNQDKIDELKDTIRQCKSNNTYLREMHKKEIEIYENKIDAIEKENLDLRFKLKMLLK